MFFFNKNKFRTKWGGQNWINVSWYHSNTAYPDEGEKSANEIVSFAKKLVTVPVLVTFNKTVVGIDSRTGREVLWSYGVSVRWPGLAEETPAIIQAIQSIKPYSAAISVDENCSIDSIIEDSEESAVKKWRIKF